MPFWVCKWNAQVSSDSEIRDGQVLTDERITPGIVDHERLLPENNVLAKRMREWCLSFIGPRLWQPLLALKELALVINQRDERNRNVKHAADKLGQPVEGLFRGRVEEADRTQGPQAFRRGEPGKLVSSRHCVGCSCVHQRPSEHGRCDRVLR